MVFFFSALVPIATALILAYVLFRYGSRLEIDEELGSASGLFLVGAKLLGLFFLTKGAISLVLWLGGATLSPGGSELKSMMPALLFGLAQLCIGLVLILRTRSIAARTLDR